MKRQVLGRSSLNLVVAATIASLAAVPGARAVEYTSPTHVFSIDDIQGAFNGSTYGAAGAVIDKQGVTLYPIDSEFGFYIVDFLGASRTRRMDGLRARTPGGLRVPRQEGEPAWLPLAQRRFAGGSLTALLSALARVL